MSQKRYKRAKSKRRYRSYWAGRFKRELAIGALAFAGIFVVGTWNSLRIAFSSDSPTPVSFASLDRPRPHLELCGNGPRHDCVVDGDTLWLDGVKIRVADIDTPEVSEPKCHFEYELGMRATYRLRDILNEGPFSLGPIGARDEDQHGRKLRVITRSGQSLGNMLVAEGLARTWTGRREPWC